MKREPMAILIMGVAIGLALWALSWIVNAPAPVDHPSPPAATPATVPARPLRTMTQEAP